MAVGDRWRARVAGRIVERLPPRVRRAVEEMSRRDVFLNAAGLAFYGLISLVPLTVVAMWITSLAAGEGRVQQLARMLSQIAPQGLGADRAIRRVAQLGTTVGVASVVAALWPATAYGSGLARAFRRLSPKPSEELTGLLGRLLILLLLPLFVGGAMVGAFAASSLVGGGALRVLGYALGLVAAFVGSGLATAVILRVFPPEDLPWGRILRGTAVASGGVALLTVAFALALGLGADFGQHYAISGVASIVLLGLWLFLANALLLLGYRVALSR
jgi:membrane protein